MAAKKKTTRKTAAKKTATRRPDGPSAAEQSIRALEERVAALEAAAETDSPGEVARELRELRLSLLPTLETYRNNIRARAQLGIQMPWVLGGTIAVILIVVGVLAANGKLSADAVTILIGGTLLYAIVQLRNYLVD